MDVPVYWVIGGPLVVAGAAMMLTASAVGRRKPSWKERMARLSAVGLFVGGVGGILLIAGSYPEARS